MYLQAPSYEISPVLREESSRAAQCQPPLPKHGLELGAKRHIIRLRRGDNALACETGHEAIHIGSLCIGH
jgi:hypothetical protein